MEKLKSNLLIQFLPIQSGTLLGLAINEVYGVSLGFLSWFCLIPLFIYFNEKQTFRNWLIASYGFSATFSLFSLLAFVVVNPLSGTLLIFSVSALFTIPFLVLYGLKSISKHKTNRIFYFLPFIWPAFEWFILEHLFSFPLLPFANNQANYHWLIQYIDTSGYTGISFWVITVNIILYQIFESFRLKGTLPTSKTNIRLVIALIVSFVLPLLYTWYSFETLPNRFLGEINVTVVQPNLKPEDTSDSLQSFFFDRLIALSDSAVKQTETDLLVWPESAILGNFRYQEDLQQILSDKVLKWQTPLVSGTLDIDYFPKNGSPSPLARYLNRDYRLYNSVVMLTPQLAWKIRHNELDGSHVALYRKQHLMPFTEYVPFAEEFPFLSQIGLKYGNQIHLSKGSKKPYLRFLSKKNHVISLSPLICWDLLFSTKESSFDPSKIQFITAHSNESLLGDGLTTTVHEMKNYTRLRSIENRKSIVKSSTTGLSLFVNPFGEVYGVQEWFKEGFRTKAITLVSGSTFYTTYSHWFPTCSLFSISIILLFFQLKPLINTNNHGKKYHS